MGSLAFTDARVEINATDMSQYVTSVELPIEFEALEDTAMGDSGRSRIAGLQDSNISITFNQDFASGAVDETIFPLLGSVVTINVRPTSAAISTTNPEYSGDYLVNQWNPFANSVGELAQAEVEWPLSDPAGVTRATA